MSVYCASLRLLVPSYFSKVNITFSFIPGGFKDFKFFTLLCELRS